MNHAGARQYHYCNNYFVKSEEKMKKASFKLCREGRIYFCI